MDIAELDALVRQHGKAIYGFCLRLAPNETDAEDLYQETFLKAVELCPKLDNRHNPKGFLLSVAIGLHRNHRRKSAWRHRIAPTAELKEDLRELRQGNGEGGAATPEDILLSNERRTAIRAAADRLNDRLKIPLYLYYTAEMSVEDIAAVLKIPQGTVKSRLHKARALVKSILEDENHEIR